MAPPTLTVPDKDGNMVEIDAQRVEQQNTEAAEKGLSNARQDDFFIRVGHCTEALHRFLKTYIADYGLTQEEAIAAVYLMNINNREFAPEDAKNWKEYYDSICQVVWDWFQEHNKE